MSPGLFMFSLQVVTTQQSNEMVTPSLSSVLINIYRRETKEEKKKLHSRGDIIWCSEIKEEKKEEEKNI
ncbi:hypothetical protein ILYODFUR_021431 [Ilyodon furcidens]|uniref:Uncharacterized protein n=1 Tax=Ilyodon furcidens TaxID=33524 RepID=A0ABV0TA43_9TELE